MRLASVLAAQGVKSVAVIDDVFDDAPHPDEVDDLAWSTFFDDIDEETEHTLNELHPEYAGQSVDDLKQSSGFVRALWQHRMRPDLAAVRNLLDEYENRSRIERQQLDAFVLGLEAYGLSCSTMGREPDEQAKRADLLFVDLFLGHQQSDEDMDRSIQAVGDLVEHRAANPPLVVLMSRSPRLQQKRNDFRDRAGLLGSTYRVISKAELFQKDRLEAMLTRLASHYGDAKRVAGFLHAWNAGLDRARLRFVAGMRRLDLSDIGQIQTLLLDTAGQSLGEYLLDVADGVLRHEVENEDGTISAAIELNRIDIAKYPGPHLEGTPDLQEFVHRMLFVHSDRLRLSERDGNVQLRFGDVLRWTSGAESVPDRRVSLVVTPACDLVRRRAERVLLLSGTLEELQPTQWSYRANPVRTAIVILASGERKWIKWNLKEVKALDWSDLDTLINDEGQLERIGRLRGIYAMEIQQRLLADLGRIGRPANLPVPFRVAVSVFYVDSRSLARRLDVPEIVSAACYVGRDGDSKPVHRLVLTEQVCDEIEEAVRVLNDDAVHCSAKRSLAALKADGDFFARFEHGEVEIQPDKDRTLIKGADGQPCAEIVRRGTVEEGTPMSGSSTRVAVVFRVTNLPEQELSETESDARARD